MHYIDPHYLIHTFGLWGIIAIVFAESGLFFGFFLPGDSLLVTAGILASSHGQDHINLAALLVGCPIAAILGDQVGYLFGARVGTPLFTRPGSRFFKPRYVQRAHTYLEERGAGMIVLARFIPGVRTFTPIVAGASAMRYRLFVPFNIAGGVLWACGVTLAGYALGNSVAHIDKYLIPVIGLVIAVSLIPVVLEVRRVRAGEAEPAERSSDPVG